MRSINETRGFTLVEALIALVVIAVGLLGMAGLQIRAQQAELEALQRSQALILLEDMANRLGANRSSTTAQCYAITTEADGSPYAGTGFSGTYSCTGFGTTATQARAIADLQAWHDMLTTSLVNARGCIEYDDTNDLYTIAVAWQGLTDTTVPANNCASSLYGEETKRRVLTRTLRLPELG